MPPPPPSNCRRSARRLGSKHTCHYGTSQHHDTRRHTDEGSSRRPPTRPRTGRHAHRERPQARTARAPRSPSAHSRSARTHLPTRARRMRNYRRPGNGRGRSTRHSPKGRICARHRRSSSLGMSAARSRRHANRSHTDRARKAARPSRPRRSRMRGLQLHTCRGRSSCASMPAARSRRQTTRARTCTCHRDRSARAPSMRSRTHDSSSQSYASRPHRRTAR